MSCQSSHHLAQSVHRWFERNQQQVRADIINLTKEMVRHKTVNVTGDKLAEHPYLQVRGQEEPVAKIVQRELSSINIPFTTHARVPMRPNVIARFGQNVSGTRLLLAGHMDVVPSGTSKDWTKLTDPFDPIEQDGVLYGRGVLDNKGPLASSLVAVKMLHEALGPNALRGQLQLAALCDEEATDGPDCGVGFLLEHNLLDATCAIVPDIGEFMKSIDVAEKGGGVVRITAKGVQAHGSTPERGVNAIYKMAALVSRLQNLAFSFDSHPLLGGPTLNVGEISGGAAPNIVPSTCTIHIDVRLVPGQSIHQLRSQMEAEARAIADDFVVEVLTSREPHAMDPQHPLVGAIQKRAHEVLGFEPQCMGLGGATFAKWLNLAGIPAVGWGPGDDNAFHVADEYVSVDELVRFCLVVSLVAVDLLA